MNPVCSPFCYMEVKMEVKHGLHTDGRSDPWPVITGMGPEHHRAEAH